jgi:hypothetical protein
VGLLRCCENARTEITDLTDDTLQTISDPGRSEAELMDAIARLGAVTEPPAFWIALANSAAHSAIQRRHYVLQLLRRHVAPGMTLSQLAQLLDEPVWLHREDIEVIEDLGGTIPVRMRDGDTVFRLRVAPGPALPDFRDVYIRVAGKVGADQLYALLRDKAGDQATGLAGILEIGFSPPP